MCRNEAPVNYRIPAISKLAEHLRQLRNEAAFTNVELALQLDVDIVTVRRAASGNSVPKRQLVEKWAKVCGKEPEPSVALWRMARYRARRVKLGLSVTPLPNPDLVSTPEMLSQALAELYERAGAPSYRRMEELGGKYGVLPRNTARRIVQRQTLPCDEEQFLAFLTACEVRRPTPWIEARNRVVSQQQEQRDIAKMVPTERSAPVETLRRLVPRGRISAQSTRRRARGDDWAEVPGQEAFPGLRDLPVETPHVRRTSPPHAMCSPKSCSETALPIARVSPRRPMLAGAPTSS